VKWIEDSTDRSSVLHILDDVARNPVLQKELAEVQAATAKLASSRSAEEAPVGSENVAPNGEIAPHVKDQEPSVAKVSSSSEGSAVGDSTRDPSLHQSVCHTFGIVDVLNYLIGGCGPWLVTPAQLMCTADDVRSYPIAVITLIREALEQLHEADWAHHDVRWPNVCFFFDRKQHLRAAFIDLDRMSFASDQYEPHYDSTEFYGKPSDREDWTYGHEDMKQLAMLGLSKLDEGKEAALCEQLERVKKAGKFPSDSPFHHIRAEFEQQVKELEGILKAELKMPRV